MEVKGFGIPPIDYTASGMPSADSAVLQKLAGNVSEGRYGLAYDHFEK